MQKEEKNGHTPNGMGSPAPTSFKIVCGFSETVKYSNEDQRIEIREMGIGDRRSGACRGGASSGVDRRAPLKFLTSARREGHSPSRGHVHTPVTAVVPRID